MLDIPTGFEIEIIPVYDAKSMTMGYQKGMKQSNAKYKIYLHQDTFLLKKDMLEKLILMFQSNPKIGMLGLIGAKERVEDGFYIGAWDYGSLYHNIAPGLLAYPRVGEEKIQKVEAIDGFFMMTQYDVDFRVDLFDGWDFYDASMVQEMKKAGYQTVVVYQEEPYAYHNNHFSKIEHYENYRKIYEKEYLLDKESNHTQCKESEKKAQNMLIEKEQLGNLLVADYRKRINQGAMEGVFDELRENKALATFDCVKDFVLLRTIFDWENQFCQKPMFFAQQMEYKQMIEFLQNLIFLVKRVEFGKGDLHKLIKGIKETYSDYAILAVIITYGYHKEILKDRFHLEL